MEEVKFIMTVSEWQLCTIPLSAALQEVEGQADGIVHVTLDANINCPDFREFQTKHSQLFVLDTEL